MNLTKNKLTIAILMATSAFVYAEETDQLDEITVTAEQQLKQSLGVSQLPAKEIEKVAVVNDVSDLVRKMPGVNLTSNSANGERGNARQIDIRGMGPENTLILIDGRPVTSRNSVRYSWRGQRDTRGDSNWVPVEEIESIEVLRGPAAARYGSGSMGGVVNITTKKATNEVKGSITYYTNQPEDSKEGNTNRVGFNLSGPLAQDKLYFRLYGNWNKTKPDALNINSNADSTTITAGREGVRNKDIAGQLSWKIDPRQTVDLDISYSRQGNLFAGDSQHSNMTESQAQSLYKSETNRMYRQSYSVTHNGDWGWGTTKFVAQFDRTTNSRLSEALAGGPEGRINSDTYFDSVLKTSRLAFETSIPFVLGVPNVVTMGVDFTHDSLDDPASMRQSLANNATFSRFSGVNRGKQSQDSFSAFIEDNILIINQVNLIPALRFDHNSRSGSEFSPALNAFYNITENFTIKGGIARAYKAPNLYQSTEGYLLYTRGNGCPLQSAGSVTSCYLMGNSDLKPETSWNKEIGFEYHYADWKASLAYFHNDYRNKISAGTEILETVNGHNLLQWENVPKAVVSGVEGNLTIPLIADTLTWTNNFTYMIESKDKSTGNPLSIIPKYTINTFLDWQINEKWDAQLNATFYGRQKPRKYAENNTENRNGLSTREVGSYTLVGINTGYQFNKYLSVRVGISNLFNKKLYRANDGASTYNEPGRAYYGRVTISF